MSEALARHGVIDPFCGPGELAPGARTAGAGGAEHNFFQPSGKDHRV